MSSQRDFPAAQNKPFLTGVFPPQPRYQNLSHQFSLHFGKNFSLHHNTFSFQNLPGPVFSVSGNSTILNTFTQTIHHQPQDQTQLTPPKIEDTVSIDDLSPESTIQSRSDMVKFEVKTESEVSLEIPLDPEVCFEAQIQSMIQFFIKNFGIATKKEIDQAKQYYSQNEKLLAVFKALHGRYSKLSKTKEDMIKWIIRHSLKTGKQLLKKKQTTDQKIDLKDICNRYFKAPKGEDEEVNEDFVDTVLPFRNKSRNKTMNTAFLVEIFQSEEFRADYKYFVENFDEFMQKENAEKTIKFAALLASCAKKGNFTAMTKYRQMPWLEVWVQNTKNIAQELNERYSHEKAANKQTKLEICSP